LTARLDALAPSVENRRGRSEDLQRRLQFALQAGLARKSAAVTTLTDHLAHLNPQAVLNRGYSIVRDREGNIVQDSQRVAAGDAIAITLAQGALDAIVRTSTPPARETKT
ncbi:MAG: exodeoxyribonuclease VII large subunit, partial [Hydrogenophilaceae bacterium]